MASNGNVFRGYVAGWIWRLRTECRVARGMSAQPRPSGRIEIAFPQAEVEAVPLGGLGAPNLARSEADAVHGLLGRAGEGEPAQIALDDAGLGPYLER